MMNDMIIFSESMPHRNHPDLQQHEIAGLVLSFILPSGRPFRR